jgi:uncharacterized protein (TIGR02246 family)
MRNRIILALLLGGIGLPFLNSSRAQNATSRSDEEQAIRKDVDAYADSYNKGDIEAVGRHWTPDAEYINDEGKTTKGRDAIVKLFKKGRVSRKGFSFKATVQSVRLIKPDVALEDGTVTLTAPDGTAEKTPFSAVLVKTDGAWLMSRVQDIPSANESDEGLASKQLKQLDWLVGQWEDEQKDVNIRVNCRWAPGKSFLIQEYTIKRPGADEIEIYQRVGLDPINGHLRSWIFDSRGGFSEGIWQRNGNRWDVAVTGVLPDGRRASARQIWSFVDDKHYKWQAVDREVDGHPLADSLATFRRVEPAQTTAAENNGR